VIVVGLNYGPERDPMAILGEHSQGAISAYAQGRDYHHVLKKKLRVLTRYVADSFDADVKLFVDTAPVMEKPLAQAAGLGWQGKHSNLVARGWGSWLFLGEIYTDLALEADDAETDHCGGCTRCLSACPTDAFPAPYKLDARRCISYLTIEHKGHIDREFRVAMGNRIFGCDDCLAVCPWNKFAQRCQETDLSTRIGLAAPLLADLATLDDTKFRSVFSGSPVKRIGRNRFIRNVLIAIGNSGDGALMPIARDLLDDESDLVRAMAIWALSRLLTAEDFAAERKARIGRESDRAVRDEWG
jgi:epoxyqueuosine reductase